VFFSAIPHFHEDKFTTPFAPFSKGDSYIAYIMMSLINKMKIPIQLN